MKAAEAGHAEVVRKLLDKEREIHGGDHVSTTQRLKPAGASSQAFGVFPNGSLQQVTHAS